MKAFISHEALAELAPAIAARFEPNAQHPTPHTEFVLLYFKIWGRDIRFLNLMQYADDREEELVDVLLRDGGEPPAELQSLSDYCHKYEKIRKA